MRGRTFKKIRARYQRDLRLWKKRKRVWARKHKNILWNALRVANEQQRRNDLEWAKLIDPSYNTGWRYQGNGVFEWSNSNG